MADTETIFEELRDESDGDPTFTFACGRDNCDFVSTGHPTETSARRREVAHEAEHEGADPVDLAQPNTATDDQ